jgi:hypothetical protein
MLRRLDVHEAARGVRIMLERERTSQNWVPKLIMIGPTPRGRLKHIDDFIPTKLNGKYAYRTRPLSRVPRISTRANSRTRICIWSWRLRKFASSANSCRTWTAQCHFAVRSTCLLAALIAANSEISPLACWLLWPAKEG